MPAMRRLFALLLIAFLPFQATWAAAAAYCQHETGTAAQAHFGHHEHVHADTGDNGGAKKAVHADCAVCHMIALQAVLGGTPEMSGAGIAHDAQFPSLPVFLAAAPVSLPERPQWRALA